MVAADDRVTYAMENMGVRVEFDWRSTAGGFVKLAGMQGSGLAPTDLRVDQVATGGGRHRSTRRLPRQWTFPVAVTGSGRQQVEDRLRQLVAVMSDRFSAPLLVATYPDSTQWQMPFHYSSGFDYQWGSADTDGRTTVQLDDLQLVAPYPYWVSRRETVARVTMAAGRSRGLISPGGNLSQLRVGASSATGSLRVTNNGDIDAYPVWTLRGPGTRFVCRGADGVGMELEHSFAAGETVTIDSRTKQAYTSSGENLYPKFNGLPKFFPVRPGAQTVTARLDGAAGSSAVTMSFLELRELVF